MKNKDTYNLILTCLSNMPRGNIINIMNDQKTEACSSYYYYHDNGKYDINNPDYTGYMTNEPGVKSIMNELNKNNDELDMVYYVRTETVSKKMNYDIKGEFYYYTQTHEDFFKEQIENYAKEIQVETPIMKSTDPISNSPLANELMDLSVQIARNIIELKKTEAKGKDFNLYIESNGGFRDFVLIVAAVLQTLNTEEIHIKKVIGVNYDIGSKEGYILDKTNAYRVYDLYSGIDEFINYGRSFKIKQYFAKSNSQLTSKMKDVLNAITAMSNSFNLCRPEKMMQDTKKLKQAIDIYEKDKNHSEIFSYLTMKIKDEYQKVFKSFAESKNDIYNYEALRQMIKYCLKHYLVQQAITLYSECIPETFYTRKVVYPKDLNHFNRYLRLKNSEKPGYTFVQNYIFVNFYDKKTRIGGLISHYIFKHGFSNEAKNKVSYDFRKPIESKEKTLVNLFNEKYLVTKYTRSSAIEAVKNYLLIKEARNFSNHASNRENQYVTEYFNTSEDTVEFIKGALEQLDSMVLK